MENSKPKPSKKKAAKATFSRKGNNVTPAATSSTASLQKGIPQRFGHSVAKDPNLSHPAEASQPKSYADAVQRAPASGAIPRNAANASIAGKGNNVTPAATSSTASLQKRSFGDQAISVAKGKIRGLDDIKGKEVVSGGLKVVATNYKLDPNLSHPAESSKPKSYADAVQRAPASSAIPRNAANASIAGKGNSVSPAATSSTASLQKRSFGDQAISVAKGKIRGLDDIKGKEVVSGGLKEKERKSQEANEKWKTLPEGVKYLRNCLQKNVPIDGIKGIDDVEELKSLHNDLARYLEQEQELANAFATVEVSSESDKCDPQQSQQIGQNLERLTDKKLSEGKNQDNIILWGTYKVPTAVKRLRKADYDMNAEKIQILIKDSKKRPNSVTYYGVTSDEEWSYVAMEPEYYLDKTSFSLDELVQLDLANSNPSEVVANDRLKVVKNIVGKFELIPKNGCPIPDLLWTVMRKVLCGLVQLHALGISHGDLKPHNIRIIKEGSLWHVKLSDMGFKTGSGTLDRQACCDHGNHIWVDDMLAFGGIFSYCITGISEFGGLKRNTEKRDSLLQNYPEARHLFLCLTSKNHTEHLTAKEALRHPHFWNPKEKLLFLLETYKRVYDFRDRDLRNELETISSKVIEGEWKGEHVKEWNNRIDEEIMNYATDQLKKYSPDSTYKYDSLPELLRVIRHTNNHYGRCPPNIQKSLGSLEEGFYNYFETRFPNLLIEVYTCVEKWYVKESVAPVCWLRGPRRGDAHWITVQRHRIENRRRGARATVAARSMHEGI